MKSSLLALLILQVFAASWISAQDSHVRTHTSNGRTLVETDVMYVVNNPQQFMQIALMAHYWGERLKKPVDKVDLVLWSFSRKAKFKDDRASKVTFVPNGEGWTSGRSNYVLSKGETKDGQDFFWNENRLGQPSPLPAFAKIKDNQDVTGIYMEQIFLQLKAEELLRIATAKTLEIRLADTSYL